MTEALSVVTLVAVGVLVVALAAYLLTIIAILRHVRHTVGLILFGIRSIAHRAQPIGEIVGQINADLGAVRDALVARVGGLEGEPTPEPTHTIDEPALAPVEPAVEDPSAGGPEVREPIQGGDQGA